MEADVSRPAGDCKENDAWRENGAAPRDDDAMLDSTDDEDGDDDGGAADADDLGASAEELNEYRKWAALEDEPMATSGAAEDEEAYTDDESADSRVPVGPPRREA